MTEDKNKDAFLNAIKGALPIKKSNKTKKLIPIIKKSFSIKKNIEIKKKFDQNEVLEKKKPLKNFLLQKNKKLKKGKIPINKRIDFHGFSLLEAENLFNETVVSCYEDELRCILFITGKGILKKKDNFQTQKLYYGKIRNNFLPWTKKKELNKYILSVEQAGLDFGADGAFFVYLRKKK